MLRRTFHLIIFALATSGLGSLAPLCSASTCEPIENGYRLANDRFEAIVSVAGETIGVTRIGRTGESADRTMQVVEKPLTLRLATDAPRLDIPAWNFHSGSGDALLPPQADWQTQLGLHKSPVPNGAGPQVQRLNDTLLGPPFYTDTYYPGYAWYRRMVALPKEWEGKPVVFVLGGPDEYDWRAYWVYLNGERIGQSSYDPTYNGPWHETPRYMIQPDTAAYKALKFGQENLLAVQARGLDRRTPNMHRLDLERYSGQSRLVDQYVAGGEPTRDVSGFRVSSHRGSVDNDVAAVELVMNHPSEPITITARYWLAPDDAALHKRFVVRNDSSAPITLLEADVLSFTTGKQHITGGGQGWPVHIGEDAFAGVCHPAGVARWGKDGVRLQVLPGATLDPAHDREYVSKTAVVGVGDGPRAFADYLQAHGRRKPQFLNMYSLYGLAEIATGLFPKVELTDALLTQSIDRMRELKKRNITWDYYCIDTGWNDPHGDLKSFHPGNFPNGGERQVKEIRDLGMKPLLWISPAQGPAAFRPEAHHPTLPAGGEDNVGLPPFLCMANEKWRIMLRDAMLHHIKSNGVRGFKLDEVAFYCGRSTHGHLPNKYGIEKQMDAFIDTLDQCKQQSPDLFLMLYWRFTSPWWLLHTDTIYQRGLSMEGATPSAIPARLTRQSATISLDQGHDLNWNRMPLIAQDSLGVWLSNTRWGSWMGAEGWRDAWVMDFVRGNMMHQLWGDLGLLDEEDVEFLETIHAWTRDNWELLKHPRRILGSPWEQGPYGYACSKDDRGVIVVHNADFAANTVRIPLNDAIGLQDKAYDVRWIYKAGSVKAQPTQRVAAGELLEVPLGSFEVAMADISPAGAAAAANGSTDAKATQVRVRAGARRLPTRLMQTSYRKLDWSDPEDHKRLARIVNGRTRPTHTPDALVVGPDLSDERDRDGVMETRSTAVWFPASSAPSKLLVVSRTDRAGIAWHHLAPFTIIQVAATGQGKPLEVKTTPHTVHEQAGGWSWMLHEFDVPPGCGTVELKVNSCLPKSVDLASEVWHTDK